MEETGRSLEESFYRRLRRLRQEKRLTMREVAGKIGVPITTYREWEYGRGITGEPYMKIAEALGVSLTELMTGQRPGGNELLSTLNSLETQVDMLRRQVESAAPLRA